MGLCSSCWRGLVTQLGCGVGLAQGECDKVNVIRHYLILGRQVFIRLLCWEWARNNDDKYNTKAL